MREIDKQAFSAFLAELRKEKGYTQKELAERVFVSDKAVSKWERGLSMPDISLLIPLAETLGVTVTELLEGRRVENPEPKSPEQVEALVKKALTLNEEIPDLSEKWRKGIFGAGLAAVALECLAILLLAGSTALLEPTMTGLELLSIFFGVYFWFFLKDRLPSYYDENRINYYCDGFLRLNLPGVAFNNSNWPQIASALRTWSLVTMVTIPLISLALTLIPMSQGLLLSFRMIVLGGYLMGLFLPVYFIAYGEKSERRSAEGEKKKYVTALAALILVLCAALMGGRSFGTLQIGYIGDKTIQSWAAGYYYLNGTQVQTIHRKGEDDFILEVETDRGSLAVEIRDKNGLAFSRKNLPTGEYPVTLKGTFEVTVKANGHKGRFRIAPAP